MWRIPLWTDSNIHFWHSFFIDRENTSQLNTKNIWWYLIYCIYWCLNVLELPSKKYSWNYYCTLIFYLVIRALEWRCLFFRPSYTANPVWFINSRKSFSIGSIPISNYMFLNRIINFRCELWTGSCGGQARKGIQEYLHTIVINLIFFFSWTNVAF